MKTPTQGSTRPGASMASADRSDASPSSPRLAHADSAARAAVVEPAPTGPGAIQRWQARANSSPRVTAQRRQIDQVFPAARADASQATVGAQGRVLQRYRDSEDFAVGHAEPEMFVTQPVKPEIVRKDAAPADQLPYAFSYPRTVVPTAGLELRVADDGSMAIQKTSAEAKEFYTRRAIVEDSNDALDALGSSFLLDLTAASIQVGGETLRKVRPVNRLATQAAERHANMIENICIKISGHVIGTHGSYGREAVLGSTAEGHAMSAISPNSTSEPRMARLAHYLVHRDDVTPAHAEHALSSEEPIDEEAAGMAYGVALGKGELDEKSRALGINRYARPEVGQGLGTFGNPGAAPNLDYAALLEDGSPTDRGDTWGYHFAGVVARAPAADDFVTLENYNRGPDMEHKLRDLHVEILRNYASELWSWWNKLSVSEQDDESGVREKFTRLAGEITRRDGVHEYFRLQREAKPDEKWFFAMYGSRVGQSFHEKQAASGEFVNPLTVTVRKGDLWVNRLRDDLAKVLPEIGATHFEDADQAGLALRLQPAHAELRDMVNGELRIATQLAATMAGTREVGDAKLVRMRERSKIVNGKAMLEIRNDLRAFLHGASTTNHAAALRVLDAFATLNFTRWWA